MYHYLCIVRAPGIEDGEEWFHHYDVNDVAAEIFVKNYAHVLGGSVFLLFNSSTHTRLINGFAEQTENAEGFV